MRMPWFVGCLLLVFCGLSQPLHAGEIYAKVGILGAGLGYSQNITDHFSLRTDFTVVRGSKHHLTWGPATYDVSLHGKQWGVYGDWFPFGNGFRLSGGIHARKLQVRVHGRAMDSRIVIDNGLSKFLRPGDTFTGSVTFPTVAPYLGIGWGYHATQKTGFAFVLDLGIAFGMPSASLTLSNSLRSKLKLAQILRMPGAASAEHVLEDQRKKLIDKVRKFKVFPQAYVGISYRF